MTTRAFPIALLFTLATLLHGCEPTEHGVLLSIYTQADVYELESVQVLSLDEARPVVVSSPQLINRTRDDINGLPLRLPIVLPYAADILVHVRASTPEGGTLVASRCYQVNGILEDAIVLFGPIEDQGLDADGDTFVATPGETCLDMNPELGEVPCRNVCASDRDADCADDDPSRFPGASPDLCEDGIDQDCDGVDPNCGDFDGDGWTACRSGDDSGSCDCNDSDPTINPDVEDCSDDGVDQNCDGFAAFCDRDNDGFPSNLPTGGEPDCNDDPEMGGANDYPGAPEVCDGRDNDCNGARDDSELCRVSDADGDGIDACDADNTTDCDCNDCNSWVRPGRREFCGNGVDDNCNGLVDEDCPAGDADGDGFSPPRDCNDMNPLAYPGSTAADRCEDGMSTNCLPDGDASCEDDADGDGWVGEIGQGCAEDPNRNPDIPEVCDDIDNNCDGFPNEIEPEGVESRYPYGPRGCILLASIGTVVDFRSSMEHCGGCGTQCPPSRADLCVDGQCDCDGEDGIATCGESDTCCAAGCVDLMTDATNCGACGVNCGLGETCVAGLCTCGSVTASGTEACPESTGSEWNVCCDGACTDVRSDVNHCNTCGNQCVIANATPQCVERSCRVLECDPGYDDCIEPTLACIRLNRLDHCGACGVVCDISNADETCATGECRVDSCGSGFADCDGDGATCETPLNTLTDCGGCGTSCSLPHATPTCATRSCQISSCDDGWADCDGASSNGCEVNIDTDSHCGRCGNTCRSNQSCVSRSCECDLGWLDCAGDAACETPYSTTRCGACGASCGPGETCNSNGQCVCGSSTASSGSGAYCNSNEACCAGSCRRIDTITDCGTCDVACGAGETCSGGTCRCGSTAGGAAAGAACSPGQECCSGTCRSLATVSHCTACDNVCGSNESCGGAGCTCGATSASSGSACTGATECCGSSCINTTLSTTHCRSCFNDCGPRETCGPSGCTCGPDTATNGPACSGTDSCCSTGCTNTNTNSQHCGLCENACASGERCSAGSCNAVSCPSHASGSPTCTCDPGYTGTLTFNASSRTWSGTCALAACPSNASGAPSCQCDSGYRGTLTWNDSTDSWAGVCVPVTCPSNASGAPFCDCNAGYTGSLTWNASTESWDGSCTLSTCPANASGAPTCSCDAGYHGTLSWNTTTNRWNGSCALRVCPSGASGAPSCDCDAGYSGSLSWNSTSQNWSGTCTLQSCPSNASGAPSCNCDPGYSGTLSWNTATDSWTGSCASVCGDGIRVSAETCDEGASSALSCGECASCLSLQNRSTGSVRIENPVNTLAGHTFTLHDGTTERTFEFIEAGDSLSDPSHIAISFMIGEGRNTVRNTMRGAINTSVLRVNAVNDGGGRVAITHDRVGFDTARSITASGTQLTISGMSGGTGTACTTGTACDAGQDCESALCTAGICD